MAISIWNRWMHYPSWWRGYRLSWTFCFLFLLRLDSTVIPHTRELRENDKTTTTVLLAVGDIADCNYAGAQHMATAALVDTLPGSIAILGDLAYPTGSASSFANCYDPVWGRHKERTRPVPGNHEYLTSGAAGYFGYFGPTVSPLEPACAFACKGYYAYDLGDWHIVALNSQQPMTSGSDQERWLRDDLARHRTQCTLAYWHHPRFSSGVHGNDERSADVWLALYESGVDLVLNGHDHNYERFAPQNPNGELEVERGIREFVVGTGGARLRGFSTIQENSEARHSNAWGVLRLVLYPDSYEWEFVPIAGQEFEDSGSAPCVTVNGDWVKRHYLPSIGNTP